MLEGLEEAGLAELARSHAALAMVPLPFYLEHGEELELEPMLEVLPESGKAETWSLVAKKGAIRNPAGLSGWEVAGISGYAPRFVSRVALSGWGTLPEDVKKIFEAGAGTSSLSFSASSIAGSWLLEPKRWVNDSFDICSRAASTSSWLP